MKKGFFITFEGSEGSGKSTQMKMAEKYLKGKGFSVLLLRDPGGTRISEAVRKVLLNKHFREMGRHTELLLYLAARAQLVEEKILPALKEKQIVISDRFEDSTLAYQGYGRNIPQQHIELVSRFLVRGNLHPDLTFLLNILPQHGMRRGGRRDRIERESMLFHRRVHHGFLHLARQHPKRFVIIDALEDKERVAFRIRGILDRVLG